MAEIRIDKELCKFCGMCAPVCPKGLIVPAEGLNSAGTRYMTQTSPEKCTGCKLCAMMCPDSAVSVWR